MLLTTLQLNLATPPQVATASVGDQAAYSVIITDSSVAAVQLTDA